MYKVYSTLLAYLLAT